MKRTCDGNDPNLIAEDGGPCKCGATFDDVYHMTYWPHQYFTPSPDAAELIRQLGHDPDPGPQIRYEPGFDSRGNLIEISQVEDSALD